MTSTTNCPQDEGVVFAAEYLPGQFDQRADSAAQCIQLMAQCERPVVRTALVYILKGDLSDEDVATLKKHVINPVETPRGFSGKAGNAARPTTPCPETVAVMEGFVELWTRQELDAFRRAVRRWPWTTHDLGVLPEVLPVGAPRPHAHGDAHDRHLLVRSLPPHHLPHRVYRRAL